jgi:hypothetical protein
MAAVVTNGKVGIINHLLLVNDEVQIMMKMENNENVVFANRQVKTRIFQL